MAHQGEVIKSIVERTGEGVNAIAKKLTITRVTLYNWFKDEQWTDERVDRVGVALGIDIYKAAPGVFGPRGDVRIVKSSSAPANDVSDFWKDKYITVMEENMKLKDKLEKANNDLTTARVALADARASKS